MRRSSFLFQLLGAVGLAGLLSGSGGEGSPSDPMRDPWLSSATRSFE